MKKRVLILLISMLIGGWIFGSQAFASSINVQFQPLKFFVNGEEKTLISGQQAFIVNGRTYVPLRFLAESLGCSVDWDRETSSIYMTISPDDIPNIQPDQKLVWFTGIWKTEAGSIYNLKQNGSSITGTFTHYAEKSNNANKSADSTRYEFPLTGRVDGKNIELTWTYDNPEEYAAIKGVPLGVAQRVVGISESASLTLNQETNTLEGYYFQDYVEWDTFTNRVLEKADGNTELSNSKIPPLKMKLIFNNPI